MGAYCSFIRQKKIRMPHYALSSVVKRVAAIRPPGSSLETPEACHELRFEDNYKLRGRISKGSFGIVHVAVHKSTGEEYAVKVMDREKLTAKETASVQREVSILKDCRDVENVVQLIDFFISTNYFFVVQVYAQGGDVFERLAQRNSYTEKEARDLAVRLLECVEVLHSRKLAHRDLKPENLLLRDMFDDTRIVVADFGFASYVPPGGLKTRCGTPAFVSPEVLLPNCRYDERVDLWSVGCLLFMILGGYPPFQDRNHRGLFKKIQGGDFVFHDTYWKNVSVPAKQLIANLLTVDPKYRCPARNALESCSWLKMDGQRLSSHDLSASLGEIKKFHARRSLKGAMHAVRWSMSSRFASKSKSTGDIGTSSGSMSDYDNMSAKNSAANLNEDQREDDDDDDNGDGDENYGRDTFVKEVSDSILVMTARPAMAFQDAYEKGRLIHVGQTSRIYECIKRQTRQVFAVKVIERKEETEKAVIGRTMSEAVLHEIAVLDSLSHSNIIHINELFEDNEHLFLVMEYMRGGNVYDRIVQTKRYTENEARKLARNLLDALRYSHQQGIVHRDLKPQNLLLTKEKDNTDIKISDWGFACRVRSPQSLTKRCGTPSYVSPEVIKNIPYDQAVDMWSVGVILYIMLCGYPPFADENQGEMFRKIRTAEFDFWGHEWESVSAEAKDLIRGLLVPNSIQRLTAREALHCAWFKNVDEEPLTETDLTRNAEALEMRKSRLKNTSKAVRGKSSTRRRGSGKSLGSKHGGRESKPRKDLGPVHLRKFEC